MKNQNPHAFGATEVSEATEAKLDKLMKLNDASRSSIKLLKGCEVNSLNYEGVVLVDGIHIYQDGKVIDTLDDDDKVADLWDEYLRNEGIR